MGDGPKKQCYNGKCYYVFTDAWHVWGRWLLLGLLVAIVLTMIPFAGYLMSLSRMRKGLSPVPGCAWMFSNPYKSAQAVPSDTESASSERPPRYRPYNMYLQYQQQLQRERIQREQEGYSTDGDIAESSHYSEVSEKPMHH